MCTAITLKSKDQHHFLARNYDFVKGAELRVALAPRRFSYLNKLTNNSIPSKYAVLGMSVSSDGYFIFADGVNEKGLTCAILELPSQNIWADQLIEEKENILPYDVTFWILANFTTVKELKEGLKNLNIVAPLDDQGALATQVHWLVSDATGDSIVIEKTRTSFRAYYNKVGVLTNSPTYDWHLTNLNRYLNVSNKQSDSVKWGNELLKPYSQGFGGLGLPGDYSSSSRFVKASFLRNHIDLDVDYEEGILECFHILNSVAVLEGVVQTRSNESFITLYTSCICSNQQIYYYSTYTNPQIYAIDLKKEALDGNTLKFYSYPDQLIIHHQN